MSKIEQYAFSCMIAIKNDIEMLHIEVRSIRFQQECYFNHFSYQELPMNVQMVFHNLSQIYGFLQRREMVYFDDQEIALKLCLTIAGEIKEFPIPLGKQGRVNVSKQKIKFYQEEIAKSHDQFNIMKLEKVDTLEQVTKIHEKAKQQRCIIQNQVHKLSTQLLQLQTEINQMRKQSQDKMQLIRKMNPKQSQVKLLSLNKFKKHQQRKLYWIEQVSRLKKERLQQLKLYINKDTNFQQKVTLSINFISLSKMLFVEIFINLQVLDLSNNNILAMEGLENLKQLLKLNLSHNRLSIISQMLNQQKLVQLLLRSNSIKKIENIFHFSNLQILNLSSNRIDKVPDEISKLNRLVQLRLYKNQISVISEKVLLLKNLKIFSVMKNKCYSEGNKSKEIVNKMMRNGIKTALEEVDEIDIL